MAFLRLLSRCALVGLLGAFSTAAAQPDRTSDSGLRYWMHGGPSVTTLGAGVIGGVALEFDRHVLSLRATSTDPAFGDETWEGAFLYGRAVFFQSFRLSGSTGISVVGGTRYGHLFGRGTGRRLAPIIGFPVEGQLAWVPAGFVAVGVRGFANVNTGQPFGGLGIIPRVGTLR